MDKDASNFIEEDELKRGLKTVGAKVSNQEFKALFEVLDENGDGKISYSEFSNRMSQFSGAKKLDDIYHWAYPIFEDIRKKIKEAKSSLK